MELVIELVRYRAAGDKRDSERQNQRPDAGPVSTGGDFQGMTRNCHVEKHMAFGLVAAIDQQTE